MLNFRRYVFEVGGERTPLSAGWKENQFIKIEKNRSDSIKEEFAPKKYIKSSEQVLKL